MAKISIYNYFDDEDDKALTLDDGSWWLKKKINYRDCILNPAEFKLRRCSGNAAAFCLWRFLVDET